MNKQPNILPIDISKPGSIPKATVLKVLQLCNVSVLENKGETVLIKGGAPEVHLFTDPIHRRMLHTLSRKFGIPIHYFYHPEMIPK